jgi:flavin reductase ActVB
MNQMQASNPDFANAFREAMRGMANSVAMVTTWFEGQPWGLTVSACCSVSATPPMLLISVGEHTVTAKAIHHCGRFGVNILSEKQVALAQFGARPRAPKFCHEHCEDSEISLERAPIIERAVAHFSCRADQEIVAGDHVIFIGVVENVTRSVGDRPLLHYERQFHKLVEEPLYTPQ